MEGERSFKLLVVDLLRVLRGSWGWGVVLLDSGIAKRRELLRGRWRRSDIGFSGCTDCGCLVLPFLLTLQLVGQSLDLLLLGGDGVFQCLHVGGCNRWLRRCRNCCRSSGVGCGRIGCNLSLGAKAQGQSPDR